MKYIGKDSHGFPCDKAFFVWKTYINFTVNMLVSSIELSILNETICSSKYWVFYLDNKGSAILSQVIWKLLFYLGKKIVFCRHRSKFIPFPQSVLSDLLQQDELTDLFCLGGSLGNRVAHFRLSSSFCSEPLLRKQLRCSACIPNSEHLALSSLSYSAFINGRVSWFSQMKRNCLHWILVFAWFVINTSKRILRWFSYTC